MLDDKDIEKLSNVFATKKDLKETFVTKEEFEGLIDIVATKQELGELKNDFASMRNDIGNIGKRLDSIDKKLDKVNVIEKEVDYIKNILNISAKNI